MRLFELIDSVGGFMLLLVDVVVVVFVSFVCIYPPLACVRADHRCCMSSMLGAAL